MYRNPRVETHRCWVELWRQASGSVRSRPGCSKVAPSGCTKSAQGTTSYCIAHGGGRRAAPRQPLQEARLTALPMVEADGVDRRTASTSLLYAVCTAGSV